MWHISFSCNDDYYAVVDIENKTMRGYVPGLRVDFGAEAVTLYFNEEPIGVATKQGFLLPNFRIKYTYEAEVDGCLLGISPDGLEEFYKHLIKKMREDGVPDKDIFAALMHRDDMLLFDEVWVDIS